MASLSKVVDEMQSPGMPLLPHGHPVLDGKFHRYGPGKKAWYKLHEFTLRNGTTVISGSYGMWQGQNENSVKITMDWQGVSPEERAEAERKQREQDQIAADKKTRFADLAVRRAQMQFEDAGKAAGAERVSQYLVRKKVALEKARITADGILLVPLFQYGRDGARLVGLQKIAADGAKLFNKGMDKIGAGCLLGSIDADTLLVIVTEGYATGCSIRMALDHQVPVMVGIDAGNLAPVARVLRRDFPNAHILFAADDDFLLEQRLAEYLAEHFKTSPVPVDGAEHAQAAADGTLVKVTASWRRDPANTAFIQADVRAGRQVRSLKFENAGISRSFAAAAAVGNASVCWPEFADRGSNKWTDFNDLHVEQSIDAVKDQVAAAVARAFAAPAQSPAPSDSEVRPANDVPAHVLGFPAPLSETEPESVEAFEPVLGFVPLEWALAHCALIQGTTDIWDSLNKLRMRRPAFVAMVGKESAKFWDAHRDRRAISPRNLPKLSRGVAVPSGGAGEENIVGMLDRYTLLYPTKTVWDADKKMVVGYDAMSLARGDELCKRWLEHPLRLEKDLDKLVFDPTQRVNPDTHINMFEGFPLVPKFDEDMVGLVLELLYNLCASEENSEEVYKWVLSWLAYPLQHPGAKMQTALLFFGEKQGTGKSLFFEGIIKPIYGAHGATGGQHQLEGTYTHWRSQKLFVLFEEILSRQDKYSYFGLIKHMITGRDTPISQKFKDDRVEANHMNVVMLSNEFQAIPLEPEDRRFLVVDVRTPLDAGLLARVTGALGKGLEEAFYAYLLTHPLDGFTPHTKPVMTPSKQRVIDFGRPDWEAFYLAWASDSLSAPFCSCLTTDLHTYYTRYCSRYGFRGVSLTKFSELVGQRLKKDRQWVAVGTKAKKLLSVFHVPQADGDDESLSRQVERFRDIADVRGEA